MRTGEPRITRHIPSVGGLALGLLILATGCGYPAVEPANQELLTSLRTALSARNPQWLQSNDDEIKSRHRSGTLGDAEYATFQALIQQARDGDWAGAERKVVAFQKAQRPSAEQIQKLRQHGAGRVSRSG